MLLDDDDFDERLQQFKASQGLTSAPSIDCACRVRSERRSNSHPFGCNPPRKFGDHHYGFRNKDLEPIMACSPYYRTPEELAEIRKQAADWATKWNIGVRFEDESFYQVEGYPTTLISFYRLTPMSEGEKNIVLRRRKRGKRLTVSAE